MVDAPAMEANGDRITRRYSVRKYVFAWLLGVPMSLLVIIYVVSHVACGG